MDAELLAAGMEEIRQGDLSIVKLLKVAMAVERNSAQIGALAACLLDGTIYTKQGDAAKATVSDLKGFAELHYVLRTVKDAADEIKKMCEKALSGTDERAGNDGHTQRFAERLRESGLTSFKIEELGSFYIKSKAIALPPSKKEHEQEIEAFTNLCKSVNIDLEDSKTTLADVQVVANDKNVKVPQYIAFKLYLRSANLTTESWNWNSLQSHIQELTDTGREVPEYIRVVKREEVQFRKA
jgi:hypothetical protein